MDWNTIKDTASTDTEVLVLGAGMLLDFPIYSPFH